MFLRKAQFILLTCIAVFLFILCFEVADIDRALAKDNPQKVTICSPDNSNECVTITNGNKLRVKNIQ
ncbi:MAG: hypothetical protein AAGJ08_06405 [Cyanobacteria bacterium P01_H01_bin.35]